MRLIVTRPREQAQVWVQALRDLQVDACALPLLGIEALDDTTALQADWKRLDSLAVVMFVSANAVRHFFAAGPAGVTWPLRLAAASTGPGTSAALTAAGVERVVQPPAEAGQFDSEALWQQLCGQAWSGCRVLIVRGEQGRSWLADTWRAAGADVKMTVAYRRVAPRWSPAEHALLHQAVARPAEHRWLFSSSEALGHLQRLAPQAHWGSSAAWATHPRIAQAATDIGFGQVQLVAPQAHAVALAMGVG